MVRVGPRLPGCAPCGKSRAQAVDLLGEAVKRYVESLRERGVPVPDLTRRVAVESVEIAV